MSVVHSIAFCAILYQGLLKVDKDIIEILGILLVLFNEDLTVNDLFNSASAAQNLASPFAGSSSAARVKWFWITFSIS